MTDRKHIFIRWWVHQLRTYDCDSSIYLMKYVIDRMELNTEQRYWFCWLYANTYQVATAWVLFNEFPDYENADQARIDRFSREHISRLPYQKDQKWLRGCLGETFASYRAQLAGSSQAEWFQAGCVENPIANFRFLWETILNDFHKFGRYTAWFYLQALKEICGLKIAPSNLMLNFDSSATHRAGLCLALGKDEWAAKGTKFTKEMLAELDDGAADIAHLVQNCFPEQVMFGLPVTPDYFSMETSLCSFKKLFRREQGRYLGYYLDRQSEDIIKTATQQWPGINWQLLLDGRNECLLPGFIHQGVNKEWFNLFLDHGKFLPPSILSDVLDEWFDKHYPQL